MLLEHSLAIERAIQSARVSEGQRGSVRVSGVNSNSTLDSAVRQIPGPLDPINLPIDLDN